MVDYVTEVAIPMEEETRREAETVFSFGTEFGHFVSMVKHKGRLYVALQYAVFEYNWTTKEWEQLAFVHREENHGTPED